MKQRGLVCTNIAVILLLFSTNLMYGQDLPALRGMITDTSTKTVLTGATIRVVSKTDSSIKHTVVTDRTGRFEVKSLSPGDYRVHFSFIDYSPFIKEIAYSGIPINLGNLPAEKQAKDLAGITIVSKAPPVSQKGDTLMYSASQFKVNVDANAEDMIKKMPGVSVENGAVKAQGEDVRRVTIDGRQYFGDDATLALRNLPAEVIDKIQVFDRLSDQAQFTGFDDGQTTKAINIVTKADMRNSQFGKLYGGYGTDDRYSAGGNVNMFNGTRRIALIGMSNNINQQNFSSQDLLGVTSNGSGGNRGGNRGGGGGRGGNFGGGVGGNFGGGNQNNFLIGQQSGISKTNSFGINYNDQWSKKTEFTASYFFNNNNNTTEELTNRQYFLTPETSQYYDELSSSNSQNYNHRIEMRLDHKFDSANQLIVTPSINFQRNKSYTEIAGKNYFTANDLISTLLNTNQRTTYGYNINNNILYRHAFKKKGRSVSIGFYTGWNENNADQYVNSFSVYYDGSVKNDSLRQYNDLDRNGTNYRVNLVYTEPIGKNTQLQFNYNPSWSKSVSDQITYHFDDMSGKYSYFDTSLSNAFISNTTTQNGGVSIRKGDRNKMFNIGVSVQNSTLDNDQQYPFVTNIRRNFFNVLPNAMINYKFNAKSGIRVFYRANTQLPSVSSLQEVIDNSNPLFLSKGNSNLQQSYGHTLSARYNFTNSQKSQSFFANIFATRTDNYVANATYIATQDSVLTPTVTLYKGSQLATPVNLDGYYNLRSFFTFGTPMKFIKSNLNLNAGISWTKAPGIVNNVHNETSTINYNAGFVIASNISERVDFNINYSANYNAVENSYQPNQNYNYFSHIAGAQFNLMSKDGWVFQNDISNRLYRGLTDGFNQNFWLWNVAVAKKFLKNDMGELRLSVFDLLKQNRAITRNVTESYVEDLRTRVLQQYFMLTFTWRFKNFVKK
ncbi:TonB-dependent receptor [Pollutibacter soli]|uniref:TonB-dependent receptor n=1 Tax=Pollutibacter soli TaxID=3034157 RepID=UPI003013A3DD